MEIQSQSASSLYTVAVQGNSSASVNSRAPVTAATSGQVPASSVAQPDRPSLEQAVRDMSELINVTEPPQLAFSIDDATEKLVVHITDASTGELIRQLPSEEALAIARSLDKLQGLLLKQEA